LDGFLGFEPRGVVIALADGLCDLREEIASAEGLRDWGRRAVPLLNYTLAFALQLRKITENLSQGAHVFSRVFARYKHKPGTSRSSRSSDKAVSSLTLLSPTYFV
jgi:hypothetical protein